MEIDVSALEMLPSGMESGLYPCEFSTCGAYSCMGATQTYCTTFTNATCENNTRE
ncbi:hypothetical protein ACNF49_28855 [Actinomadura sp. ATCC 39365]|uniref:hypothetical protein n=1 Tax=Nonomuraea sp. NPDC005692 TaxID=3157168 RepID=UPI003402B3C4